MDSDEDYSELVSQLKREGFGTSEIQSSINATNVSPELTEENLKILRKNITKNRVLRNGKPVQLIRPNNVLDENYNGLKLNRKALEEIFGDPSVKDNPVALYSLTGAFRKGKSFLLNLFLHRLRSDEPEEWLHDQNQVLEPVNGFHWRGGYEGDTKGIWIWSEPFPVTLLNGRTINLFLLDTEGAVDYLSDSKQSSIIFALSTLISSVQIYNVSQRISADDLENLQFIVDYVNTANEVFTDKRMLTPIQELIYLIRDWSDTDVSLGFKGGDKYLRKMLDQSRQEVAEEIADNVNKYFTSLQCFLLPYPGKVVAERGKQGSLVFLKDIDQKFLQLVDHLQDQLFQPKNIVVKQNNGFDVMGHDFINLVSLYFEIFERGEMPEVELILEANHKVSIVTLTQKARQQYEKYMQLICPEYKRNLIDIHQDCKSFALNFFNTDKSLKFGNKKFIQVQRKLLEEQIDQQLEVFLQTNLILKERLRNNLEQIVERLIENLKSVLEQESEGKYFEEAEQLCSENQVAIIDSFYEKVKNLDQQLCEEFKEILEEEMQRCLKAFLELNLHRKNELDRELSDLAHYCKENYISTMNRNCAIVLDSTAYKMAHNSAHASCLHAFEQCELGRNTNLRSNHKEKLLTELHEEMSKFKESNRIKKQKTKAKETEIMNLAKEKYYELMNNKFEGHYVEPIKILRAHRQCKERAVKLFDILNINQSWAAKCGTRFNEVADELFEKIEKRNKKYKMAAVNEFKKIKCKHFDFYENTMERYLQSKLYEERELMKYHEVTKQKAVVNFEKEAEKIPEEERSEVKETLENDIDNCFENLELQFAADKIYLDNESKLILQEIKTNYLHQIDKAFAVENPDSFMPKKLHETAKQEQIYLLKQKIKTKKIFSEAKKQFLQYAEDQFIKRIEIKAMIEFKKIRCELLDFYENEMGRYLQGESFAKENLNEYHNISELKVFHKFEKKADKNPEKIRSDIKSYLKQDMNRYFKILQKEFDLKMESLTNESNLFLQEVKMNYLHQINKLCKSEENLDSSKLMELHEIAKQQQIHVLKQKIKTEDLFIKAKEQFDDFAEVEFNQRKKEVNRLGNVIGKTALKVAPFVTKLNPLAGGGVSAAGGLAELFL